MKRFGLIVAVIAVLALTAVPVFSAGTGERVVQDEKVVLTYLAASNWIKDYEYEMAKVFEAETGITVDFQELPPDQYENVLRLKLTAQEGVDIFGLISGIPSLQRMQPEVNMVDLSNEPWAANLKDWARVGASYDGRLVGLNMWSVANNAIMYNVEIFERYGLEVPANYEEFLSVSDRLLAEGITPIYEFAHDLWHTQYWIETLTHQEVLRDPDFIEKFNTNEIGYSDVESYRVGLGQLKEMQERGYFGADLLSNTFEGSWGAMASGEYAMIMIWDSFGTEIESRFGVPESNFRMFPNPLAGNRVRSTTAGGILKIPYARSEDLNEVLEYFRFITQTDRLQAYYDNSPDLSVPSMFGIEFQPTAATAALDAITREEGIGIEGLGLYYDAMVLGKFMQNLFLGTMTPDDVLRQMDAERGITARAVSDPNWE